jgi:hypothetical protein
MQLPRFPFGQSSPDFRAIGTGVDLNASVSEQVYHSVRQARAENGIVLQVVGDSNQSRILPLPPENKAVYVSDLLEQTGVRKQLDAVQATLYRYSTGSIGGIKMAVKMSKDGRTVRPESDYALQAGDRLQVQQAPNPALQSLLNATLGR